MKIYSIIKAATLGQPKRVRSMILWTLLEYFLRGAPYGILLMVTWELFKPLQNPGVALNTRSLLGLSLAMFISLVLLYFVSKRTYIEDFSKTYILCTEGRLYISDHLSKLSMGFFNAHDPGSIGAYLVSDYTNLESVLSHYIPQVIGAFAMPLLLLIVLATQDWKMALIAASVIPLSYPFTLLSKAFINFVGKKHQKAKIAATSRMLEYVKGMQLIKAFNLTGTKFERLEKAFRRLKTLSIRLEAGAGPTVLLSGFILHSGFTLIILFGMNYLFAGTLSLTAYIMFLIIGLRVYEPLIQAYVFMADLNYFQLSVNRIESLRETPILAGSNPGIKPNRFNIDFNDVSFHYLEADVLQNINVSIPEHTLTAFVGPSGSGKTTMTRLIARFWDVTGGSISIGGEDVRVYNPDDLLSVISIVFQDVYLFNDTIMNNIRIGNENATDEEVFAAAKKAHCHSFIEMLPDGYQTIVGEGGSTLSGGEKQRISIARAILKDAPIILLDEATASLDPENEDRIQKAIDTLVKEKTVIIIAHRLNTVVRANKIVVLDEGRIVQEGTHDDLMQEEGLFRRMWDEQQMVREWTFG